MTAPKKKKKKTIAQRVHNTYHYTARIIVYLPTDAYVGHEDIDTDLALSAEEGTWYMRETVTSSHMQAEIRLYTVEVVAYEETRPKEEIVTLLIYDRERDNKEDFIWCQPIDRAKWNKWFELSQKFKTAVPEQHGGVRYINRMEGRVVKTILLMPTDDQTDDDALTSAAWLRVVKNHDCRMYVVRCQKAKPSMAELIMQAAGADSALVHDVEVSDADAAEDQEET